MTDAAYGVSRGVAFLIILLVSLSFALGYLWGSGNSTTPIVIEKCADA